MRFRKTIIVVTSASVAAASALLAFSENTASESFLGLGTYVDDSDQQKPWVYKTYNDPINKSRVDVERVKTEFGLPGIVVGVSVDGRTVWVEGFGYSNLETQTPCHGKTKMRIASLSKPITASLLAKQKEMGLVDLDAPIQKYVSYFPVKEFNGKEVAITPRLLACHKSGVRHYKGVAESQGDGGPEFYSTEKFSSVEQSVNLFKHDDLLFSPGDGFNYTTHGYTLLSAVIEGAGKVPFKQQIRVHLDNLGLHNIHLDEIATIVYDRASYYAKNQRGKLRNAPLADNSCKWAGGGLLSNVEDILKFADIMLYSYQQNGATKPGFLQSSTVKEMWTPIAGTRNSWSADGWYGLGWHVFPKKKSWLMKDDGFPFHVGHGGGAVGASSVLLIFPAERWSSLSLPSGVTVAIITNLQGVDLSKLGRDIAKIFIDFRAQTARTPQKYSAKPVEAEGSATGSI